MLDPQRIKDDLNPRRVTCAGAVVGDRAALAQEQRAPIGAQAADFVVISAALQAAVVALACASVYGAVWLRISSESVTAGS